MHIGFPHYYQNNGRVQPSRGRELRQYTRKHKQKTIHSKSKQIYNPQKTKHTLTFVPNSCIVNITFVILYEFEVKSLMMR